MAQLNHGLGTAKVASSVTTPVVADSGVIFAVGMAPAHMIGGKVNSVVMVNNYEEAVSALGYSDDWEKYPLCALMYSAFKLYGVSPLFMVNVLDPAVHKTAKNETATVNEDNQIKLPLEAIDSSVSISEMTAGSDYEVFYDDKNLVIEFLTTKTGSISVSYDVVDPSKVTKDDIIGGISVTTHAVTGLELIDSVYPKYAKVPDLIICPGFSHDPEVAAVMSAKCENINGLFQATCIVDVAPTVTYYQDVYEWKKSANINADNQILCFPKLRLGERVFEHSIQLACLISQTDNSSSYGDGSPCEVASNKKLQADSMVNAGGEEIDLDFTQANYLNSIGVVTALNFMNGFVSWGNWMANYPSNNDPTEYFYNESRMFKWIASSVIQTYWSYTDRTMKRRLADAILQGINDWMSALTQSEKLYGGRVELAEVDNPLVNLIAGHLTFRIFLGTMPPLAYQEYKLEYDASYITATFS